jgi:four helix bundle protein
MFAVRIVRAFAALPKQEAARIIGRQFLRSGTSVAANYRATSRARSKAEFIAKLGVVVEEADETLFWLDLLVDAGLVRLEIVKPRRSECEELVRIFASSLATAKTNRSISQSPAR